MNKKQLIRQGQRIRLARRIKDLRSVRKTIDLTPNIREAIDCIFRISDNYKKIK